MGLNVVVNGVVKSFDTITPELGQALGSGSVAYRSNGTQYNVTTYLGGFLLDGCPLNIIFGQGWITGQIEALKAGGIKPTCLVPGTPDYVAFYGQAGVFTQPNAANTMPSETPPPIGQPPGLPPSFQITNVPADYSGLTPPPNGTGTAPTLPDWSILAIIVLGAMIVYKAFKKG